MRLMSIFGVYLLLCSSSFLFAGGTDHPSLLLDKKSHVFIELGFEYSSLQSEYAFVVPSGEYFLYKSDNRGRYSSPDTTCIENVHVSQIDSGLRYQLDSGFVFFRASNDPFYINADNEKIINNIVEILNVEANKSDVHFFGYKNSIQFKDARKVLCEGQIFSPQRANDTGLFFMRKLKHSDSKRTCYLIYYDYVSEYDVARAEFERLCSCIWLISDGCLQLLSST